MFVRTMGHTLLKLALFSLLDYDLVFYTDLDVDAHSRWLPKDGIWRAHLEASSATVSSSTHGAIYAAET